MARIPAGQNNCNNNNNNSNSSSTKSNRNYISSSNRSSSNNNNMMGTFNTTTSNSSSSSNNSSLLTLADVPFNLASSGHFTPLETTLFLSAILPLIAFTLASNSFVIYAVSTFPPLKNPSNVFLLSLALTDVMQGVVVMPVACFYNVVGEWYLGPLGCKIWTFTSFFSCSSSTFHLCAIALDRYLAIARPMAYATKRSYRKSLCVVAAVWTCSFLIVSPPFVFDWGMQWPTVFLKDTPCTIPQDPSYAIYSSVGSFYLPLLVILAVYLRLFSIGRERFRRKLLLKANQFAEMAELSQRQRGPADNSGNTLSHVSQQQQPEESPNSTTPEGNDDDVEGKDPKANNNGEENEENEGGEKQEKLPMDLLPLPLPPAGKIMMVEGSKRRQKLCGTITLDLRHHAADDSVLVQCDNCRAVFIREAAAAAAEVRNGNDGGEGENNSKPASASDNLCPVCSSHDDLLAAAEKSKMSALVQKERRFAFVMSISVCAFVVCWTPGFTVFLVLAVWPDLSLPSWFITLSWWLAYSNSACNPVIYTVFNQDFRKAFLKIIGRRD